MYHLYSNIYFGQHKTKIITMAQNTYIQWFLKIYKILKSIFFRPILVLLICVTGKKIIHSQPVIARYTVLSVNEYTPFEK